MMIFGAPEWMGMQGMPEWLFPPWYIVSFLELTMQQIDDLLHEVDSLDEDKLREMHAEFMELW